MRQKSQRWAAPQQMVKDIRLEARTHHPAVVERIRTARQIACNRYDEAPKIVSCGITERGGDSNCK